MYQLEITKDEAIDAIDRRVMKISYSRNNEKGNKKLLTKVEKMLGFDMKKVSKSLWKKDIAITDGMLPPVNGPSMQKETEKAFI